MSETFKDFLGKKMKVGDFIVYPGREGSALFMNKGIVKELLESEEIPYWKAEPRKVCRLKVEIEVERYDWGKPVNSRTTQVKKLVTLTCLERCTVMKGKTHV